MLRTQQAAANKKGSISNISWKSLQHTGIPVGFAEFEARWNDSQEGELLKKIVDSFDKHGLVIKTSTTADEDEIDTEERPDISQIAKSSVRKKGDSKLRQISKSAVRSK